MTAFWRIFVAASAALLAAATPALAQETGTPAQNQLIGPPQLRDFNLNGTVTRAAEQPAQEPPAQRQPVTRQANTAPSAPASRPSPPPAQESAARPQPAQSEERAAGASSSARLELPPPTPARPSANLTAGAGEQQASIPEAASALPSAEPAAGAASDGLPIFPWLIAALAFAGAAAWYFLRQRPRETYAGAGALAFEPPAPAPRAPTPPAPAAKPPTAEPSSGIVSTRLRPWIEIEFKPQRAVVDEQKAAIQFELSVFNSGSAPARDVLVEACLFSAGPMQDQQIRTFFDNPVAQGQRVPVIGPLQRVVMTTAVVLPREQVRAIEVEGRQLFVPMVAFNALYGWGRGQGQSSVSYLVGKETSGEKLAPFRLDLGPRMFRNLAAREHELRLRK